MNALFDSIKDGIDFSGAVWQTEDGGFVTSSLKIAEYFGKNHQHVLEVIREKRSVENSTDLWFFDSTYKDAYGRNQKMVLMNQSGFMFIVMGFTGAKADEIKIGYINEFERMRKEKSLQINFSDPEFLNRILQGTTRQLLLIQEENNQLKKQIEIDAPKIQLYNILLQCENGCEIQSLSKHLGLPATFLRKYLLRKKIIFKKNDHEEYYAKYASWFKTQFTTFTINEHNFQRPKLLIMPLGIEHIARMLLKENIIQNVIFTNEISNIN